MGCHDFVWLDTERILDGPKVVFRLKDVEGCKYYNATWYEACELSETSWLAYRLLSAVNWESERDLRSLDFQEVPEIWWVSRNLSKFSAWYTGFSILQQACSTPRYDLEWEKCLKISEASDEFSCVRDRQACRWGTREADMVLQTNVPCDWCGYVLQSTCRNGPERGLA